MSNDTGAPARQPSARPAAEQRPVMSGLNLWLELKDPRQMPELLGRLQGMRQQTDAALVNLHYVHFARFLPAPRGVALQVITEFDGEFDAYVLDFVLTVGDAFDLILSYVKDAPVQSVKSDPARFLAFVRANNLGYSADQPGNIRLFSAYPQHTVLDIIGPSGVSASVQHATVATVDRADVQANVLRGVRPKLARHLAVRFGSPPAARALLDDLLTGRDKAPCVSNDASWQDGRRPPYWLCVGFTFRGLLALGISDADRDEFKMAHKAFVRGPALRDAAHANGDTGASRPAFWALNGRQPVDMVASLYADDQGELDRQCAALEARCESHDARIESVCDAKTLPERPQDSAARRQRVHFDYVDGLAHPRLAMKDAAHGDEHAGRDEAARGDDMQPLAAVGEFLLGSTYPNVFGGLPSRGGLSEKLAENATFAALRIMEQDVAGFEALLDRVAAAHGVDREWVAAKLMGRWRDGTPVSQSPDRPLPEANAPYRDEFDYLPSTDHPGTPDDSAGLRCPMGAHARRMNPRSARVAGRPHSRRLIRRGMPYGPDYDPAVPNDGQARGLIGLFFCADLDRQFEFLLRQWAQGDRATPGLVGQQDPFIGAQETLPGGPPMSGQFRIPRPGVQADIVFDMPRLVKTVGSAYLFMPGLAGLRHLADLGPKNMPAGDPPVRVKRWPARKEAGEESQLGEGKGGESKEGDVPAPDPLTFDPREQEFRDDPFAAYQGFRAHHQAATLPRLNSTWVFTHELVLEVASAPDKFRKRHSADTSPTGLLNMDEPHHGPCRNAYGALFNQVVGAVRSSFKTIVDHTYRERCLGRGRLEPIDWVTTFAEPVARGVFLEVFGLDAAKAQGVIRQVEDILAMATPADDKAVQAEMAQRQQALVTMLFGLRPAALPGRLFDRILKLDRTEPFDPKNNQARPMVPATLLEQLVNSATMAMTGILPLQWFIALACWRLLENDGTLLRQLKDEDKGIPDRDVVQELLRYDMSPPMSSRYVVEDQTRLGKLVLNKDDRVNMIFASANRDVDEFGSDADRINFKRGNRPNLAFGYGDRTCLGKELVYDVMEPVIRALRDADPVPHLARDFKPNWGIWSEGALFRAMTALMVHS